MAKACIYRLTKVPLSASNVPHYSAKSVGKVVNLAE